MSGRRDNFPILRCVAGKRSEPGLAAEAGGLKIFIEELVELKRRRPGHF
jgi:hypothetical protein